MNIIKMFPDFKTKALTLSFDDAVVQDFRLVEIFQKYRLKATININSGLFGMVWKLKYNEKTQDHIRILKEEAVSLYKGFEIACHGVTHPDLTKLSLDEIKKEVLQDKLALEKLFDTNVKGLAYPGGFFDQRTADILRDLGISYARTIESTKSFGLPEDFLQWHPTCHMFGASGLTDEFNSYKGKELKLFYIWGHSYELDREEGMWESFEKLCSAVSDKDDVWYADNIEICEYVNALCTLEINKGEPVNKSGMPLYLNIDGENIIV